MDDVLDTHEQMCLLYLMMQLWPDNDSNRGKDGWTIIYVIEKLGIACVKIGFSYHPLLIVLLPISTMRAAAGARCFGGMVCW